MNPVALTATGSPCHPHPVGSAWSAADVARLQPKPAPQPRQPAPHDAEAAPGVARGVVGTKPAPTPDVRPAGYAAVRVPEFKGRRFVAVAADDSLVAALAAVCRAHGARELSAGHFILESVPGSGPKKVVKSSE